MLLLLAFAFTASLHLSPQLKWRGKLVLPSSCIAMIIPWRDFPTSHKSIFGFFSYLTNLWFICCLYFPNDKTYDKMHIFMFIMSLEFFNYCPKSSVLLILNRMFTVSFFFIYFNFNIYGFILYFNFLVFWKWLIVLINF